MDTAMKLQTAVTETVEMAVHHLFPKVKELVAQEILKQFDLPLKPLRGPSGSRPLKRKTAPASKKIAKKKTIAAKRTGKKLTRAQMQCRHPKCTKRSMGPKYSFRCKDHPINEGKTEKPNLRIMRGGLADKGKPKIAKAA